jgi:hypothetical protein
MANSPIPDNVPSMMLNDFGTVVLITDPKSDKYLNDTREHTNTLPSGSKVHIDDYVEWVT